MLLRFRSSLDGFLCCEIDIFLSYLKRLKSCQRILCTCVHLRVHQAKWNGWNNWNTNCDFLGMFQCSPMPPKGYVLVTSPGMYTFQVEAADCHRQGFTFFTFTSFSLKFANETLSSINKKLYIKGYRPCRRPPLSYWNPCEELHLLTMSPESLTLRTDALKKQSFCHTYPLQKPALRVRWLVSETAEQQQDSCPTCLPSAAPRISNVAY